MTQERYQPVQTPTRLRLRRLAANQIDNESPPTPPQVVATAQPAAEPTPEPEPGLRLRLLRTPISALGGVSGEQIGGFTKGAAQQLITGRAVGPRYYGEELPPRPATGAEQFGAGVASFIRPAPMTTEELANPLTAAMLAVPPAGALGVTAERAAAQTLAGRTARKALAGVQAAVGRPEAAIRTRFGKAAAQVAGAQEPDFQTLAGVDKELRSLETAIGVGQRTKADVSGLVRSRGELADYRENLLQSTLTEEQFTRLQQLREQATELSAEKEAQASLQPIVRPPKLTVAGRTGLGGRDLSGWSDARLRELARQERRDPTKLDWWDSLDSKVVAEVSKMSLRATRPSASATRRLGVLQAEIAELERGGGPRVPVARATRAAAPLTSQQVGVAQAGMGIGEAPAQAGLFEGLRGEAQTLPLADAEMLAARQARAAEISRGQAEIPFEPIEGARSLPDMVAAQIARRDAMRAAATKPVRPAAQPAISDYFALPVMKMDGARIQFKDGTTYIVEGHRQVGLAYVYKLRNEVTGATTEATLRDMAESMGVPLLPPRPAATQPITEPVRPAAQPGVQPPVLEPTEPVAAQVGKAQALTPTQQVVPPRPVGPSSAEAVPSLVAKPPSPPAETPADVIDRLLKAHAIESVAPSRPPSLPPLAEGREPPVPPVPPAAGGTQLPPSGDSWIPGVRSNDAIIGMAYRNDWTRKLADQAARVPGLGKVAQVVDLPERNVFKQAEVLRASIMADWDSNSTGVVARLRSLGDSTKRFNVDKDGRALIGGDRVALNDVLEHPGQFTLTEQQTQFIQRLHKINDDKLARLLEEGIDVPQLSFEEGGHYVGRRVLGRLDSQGNLEIAATGAGARRVGAKAAFEKPRVFEEGTEEAIAAGYRYMKPEDVMQANLQAAGRRVADQRFSEFILDQVPYRTGAAPSELIVARDAAQQKLRRAVKYRDVLNRSIRGETPPESTLAAIARSYPEEVEQLRSALGDANALKGLRPMSAESISAAQTIHRDAAQALSHAQRIARTTRLGEGTVQAPAFAGKMFDAKAADAINKAMGLAPLPLWGSVAQGVAWLNAPFRMLVTTYDIGVSGIQLLMAMFKNPVVWGKATGRGLEALVSGQRYQQFLANHAETISKWSPHGAIFTPSEFTEAIRPGGLVARIPVLRSTARPFARYFEGILNAAEIYGLEAKDALNVGALRVGRGAASATEEEMADWAAHWNVMTGRFDSSRRGISQAQQYVESAVMFAPRFRRAAYTLMTDISRGGVRGEQAREALSKFLLGGTFGYIGLAYALGQEPVLDPRRRGEWMTLEVAGQRVGLGSAYVITLRLLGQVAQDIADGQPQKIAGDAGRYAKGLLAPVPGISVDVAFKPNYEKDGIQKALQLTQRVVANNLIPGWAGALLDSRAVDWESRAVGAGAQGLSLRSFPAKKTPSPSVPQPVSSSGQLRLRRQTLEPARR